MTPGIRRLPLAVSSRTEARCVRRVRPTPPLRPPEPPHGPSRGDAWRAFEEDDLWGCTYCDASFGEMVVGELDHVTPLADGGLHILFNLVPSCRECNRSKSARPVQVWLDERAGQLAYAV